MSDDWRLRIEVHEHGRVRTLLQHIDATDLEHQLQTAFHDRVVVSNEGSTIFCYAGQREQAEQARELARRFAGGEDWEVDRGLRPWHPTAGAWEGPDQPLPPDPAPRGAGHAELL